MESFTGDTEESTEDLTGRKKSRLKSLKNRLFGRTKRGDGEGDTKLSQSASDITAAKGGSEENLVCSQGMLGSRALSHDSIFLADEVMSDSGSTRTLSQENVHSKIKALQTKLQQQKMHLGPPPLVLPIRRPENLGGSSEDDGLSRSPPEMSGDDATFQGASYKPPALPRSLSPFSLAGTGSEEEEQDTSQPSSRPLSPIPRPPPTRSMPPTASVSAPLSAFSPATPPTTAAQSLDFSTPAQFTPCMDTSAARHRMSVKPRNQRVSTKGKRLNATSTEALNNIDHPVSEKEEEQGVTKHLQSRSKKSPELGAPVTSMPSEPQETPKSSSPAVSYRTARQDQSLPGAALTAPLASQIQASPLIPVDVMPSQQPQLPPIQPDGRRESPGVFQIQSMSLSKMDTRVNKTGETDQNPDMKPRLKEESVYTRLPSSLASVVAFRTSSLKGNPEEGSFSQGKTNISNTGASLQQAPGQAEAVSTRGAQRAASSSFSFSVTADKVRDGERPRSGSFLGVVEQAGTKLKREGGAEVKLPPSKTSQRGQELKTDKQEEDKPKPFEPRGGPAAGDVEGQEMTESREALEATEDQEDRGKTAFGVKLRSTSLSLKFRSDASTVHSESKVKRLSVEVGSLTPPLAPHNPASKSMLSEEQRGACESREGKGSNASPLFKKLPTITSCTPATPGPLRQTDGALNQPGPSTLPVKPDPPATEKTHLPVPPVETQTISSSPKKAESALPAPQEPQTAYQPAHQTASQPAHQTASQPAHQTASQPAHQTASQPAHQTASQPAHQTASQPAPQTASQPAHQTASQPAPQTPSQPAHQTASQPAPQTASQPAPQTASQPAPQTASQPAPQTAPSEVSWMSLAMMKTRTLQQLWTSRLPREFPSMQTAARPQAQAQPTNQEQNVAQTQTVMQSETQNVTQTQTLTPKPQQISPQLQAASQPSTETTKAPVIQTASPAQTAKSTVTLTTVQERIATQPTSQLYIYNLPQAQSTKQMSKQAYDPPLQLSTSQPTTQSSSPSVSHPAIETTLWATQSPVRSPPLAQTESKSSQHPTPRQPPWSSATQPKPTTSAQASDSTCTPSPASGRGERAADQGKGEGPSLGGRRAVWAGTMGERAAFLQKRAEWTTAPGSKVEVRKTQTPEESPASPRTTPSNTDEVPARRPGLRHPESSPTKVPGRLAGDKWIRKNSPSSSSPSSSPMPSSPLQSISDSSQPSWMELAKRKSMAWSDKTMD